MGFSNVTVLLLQGWTQAPTQYTETLLASAQANPIQDTVPNNNNYFFFRKKPHRPVNDRKKGKQTKRGRPRGLRRKKRNKYQILVVGGFWFHQHWNPEEMFEWLSKQNWLKFDSKMTPNLTPFSHDLDLAVTIFLVMSPHLPCSEGDRERVCDYSFKNRIATTI
jgi:hypothetical protein